ncbi:MAG: hypothetical protein KDA60_04070 [Planctomycetales bacterium]|nr:hypothetical protein [Planctomycetales bacterium]
MIRQTFAGTLALLIAFASAQLIDAAPPSSTRSRGVRPVSYVTDINSTCPTGDCGGGSLFGGAASLLGFSGGSSVCNGDCGGTCSSCTEIGHDWFGASSACAGNCAGSCATCNRWSAGVEFTLLKPHFEGNPAFTVMTSDGVTGENYTDSEFGYDTEFSPRVWIETLSQESLGFRVVYWQFDHAASNATVSPDANGFGRIDHPAFGDVDLSTTIPNSVYSADSDVNAYTIDMEGTKSFACGAWAVTASGGLRFGEIDQTYRSVLTDAQGQTQGTINYDHRIQGVGPTISVRTQRPFSRYLSLFATGRGSLLYGDSDSSLLAIEDQNLDNSFTTRRTTSRNDVLPIGDIQVGFQVTPSAWGVWQPYVHVAMEGQVWSGAGNASSEEGNLGFYGLNVALGFDW